MAGSIALRLPCLFVFIGNQQTFVCDQSIKGLKINSLSLLSLIIGVTPQ